VRKPKRKRKPRPKLKPQPQPHDRLFKAAMSDPTRAADLLRLVLPENVTRKLDMDTLRIERGSWVDEVLREQHSDVLLSTRYDEEPVLVYVLLEHKSDVNRWAHLQMLGYMWRIWTDRAQKLEPEALPPIIPILVSHADGGWAGPSRFADLFGDTLARHRELAAFVPDFVAVIEDLQQRDDVSLDVVALQPGVVMTLVALRDARRAHIVASLRRHMRELRALAAMRDAVMLLEQLVTYLLATAQDLPLTDFRAILAEASAEATLPTIAEELRNEGRAEGRAEGLRETVRMQLGVKFGELTAEHERRIADARIDELERFVRRLVLADSVEAVLGPGE
jgi:predicted transposase YdaD